MTPGTYLAKRRVAAGLTVAAVAAKLAAEPKLAEHARAEWIEAIEADVMPAAFRTIVALKCVFPFDILVLGRLDQIHLGADLPPPQLCRTCGCSEFDACTGGARVCCWVEPDQCSRCFVAEVEAEAARRDAAA